MRVAAQLIEDPAPSTPHGVVSHLLAMQAQDYAGALWAIGLRLPDSTQPDVERAIAQREIVRTWPMRGTLHFVAAEDVHWLLPLLTPRILAGAAGRETQLELDAATFAASRELFTAALSGGRLITRPDAMEMLESAGISTTGQRGYHILWRLAQEGLIVLGPMAERQQTFALLDEWVTPSRSALDPGAPREELLAHLARRYFTGHGPATLADLARWAGIPKRDARAALEAISDTLESADHDGERYFFAPGLAGAASSRHPGGAHLLPGFDEYMLGYTGRSHQLGEHLAEYGSRVASNGMFAPTVVIDGRAVGVWKRTLTARRVTFALTEFRSLSAAERVAVEAEQATYARFVGRAL